MVACKLGNSNFLDCLNFMFEEYFVLCTKATVTRSIANRKIIKTLKQTLSSIIKLVVSLSETAELKIEIDD